MAFLMFEIFDKLILIGGASVREAVIVAASRTAVGKAKKGSFRQMRPDDLGAKVIENLVGRVPELDVMEIEDIIMGCAFPEGEQGMNVARIISIRAGLPVEIPGITINRWCSSGLQSIAFAAERIMCGFADVVIAGGVESMTMVPFGGFRQAPNPYLLEHFPEVYMSMGETAEEVAKRYQVSREDQDRFALASHQKAVAAIEQGFFKEEIVPIDVVLTEEDENGKKQRVHKVLDQDEGVRPDTNLEVLGQLKPVFRENGTVTAGNSSQMSDGAAAVLLMSADKAAQLGLKPLGIFRGFATGGLEPDIMGMGPAVAVPKVLEKLNMTLNQIDLIELNEAFAAQSVAVMRELDLDPAKVNVNGGAIALGHPLGCTGTKLTISLLYELKRRKQKYGLVTMCVGGGMGAAAVIEAIS